MARRLVPIVALVAAAMPLPALAQHDHGIERGPQLSTETWQGHWQGEWEDEVTYRGVWRGTYTGLDGAPVEAEYRGRFVGESRFVSDEGPTLHREGRHGWREERGRHHRAAGLPLPPQPGPPAPRLAYTPYERAAWLDECRARAGFAYHGERHRAPDACEAYLLDYERGGHRAAGHDHGEYAHAPVMMVRVPIHRERGASCGCAEVIEEIVEDAPAPHPARRAAPPPARGKRIRIAR